MPVPPATAPAVARPAPDVLVIGAGAFGLWTALACRARGLSVMLADAGRIGAPEGASATPVGALAPHRPAPWTALKALQLGAILALPGRLAALEAETGLTGAAGAGRPGRVQPLADAAARARAEAALPEAVRRWPGHRHWIEDAPSPGWPAAAPFGVLRDDLTARLDPAGTARVLAAALAARGATLRPGEALAALSPGPDGAGARLAAGPVAAGAVVLAAGWRAFDALPPPLLARLPALEPEHGQAARLALPLPPGTPLIQGPGLWIVPHADGTVAVGATAERGRADTGADGALDALLARAAAAVPALAGAPVLSRWAGVRPRLAGGRPMAGRLAPGLWVAAGGFKIGLALAPPIGEAVAAGIAGEPVPLPAALQPDETA